MGTVFTVRVRAPRGNPYGRKMQNRMQGMLTAVEASAQSAAQVASRNTSPRFRRMRGYAPPRPGRLRHGMAAGLRWIAKGTAVSFDLKTADSKYPYWVIQEIGTGQSATFLRGGAANPTGRPAKGATYVKTVAPQRGRRIHIGLAWGTGPSGAYSPPGFGGSTGASTAAQQLQVASKLSGVPTRRARITIRREIRGQGMVKHGGTTGWQQYLPQVVKAGDEAFQGYPKVSDSGSS